MLTDQEVVNVLGEWMGKVRIEPSEVCEETRWRHIRGLGQPSCFFEWFVPTACGNCEEDVVAKARLDFDQLEIVTAYRYLEASLDECRSVCRDGVYVPEIFRLTIGDRARAIAHIVAERSGRKIEKPKTIATAADVLSDLGVADTRKIGGVQ